MSMHYQCHESAWVDSGAKIGKGTKIWFFSHVCDGAEVGENCILGQGTYVGSNTKIGNGVKIQNNVSVYDNVILEDDVFCGPSVVFTNVINPRAFIERKTEFKTTLVRKGSTLGANCTIVCGVELGEYSFVGAGAVITKDVPPYAVFTGVPARQSGWISKAGGVLDLPISGKGKASCPINGERYILRGNRLFPENEMSTLVE